MKKLIWSISLILLSNIFIISNSYSLPKVKKKDDNSPAILKAKVVDGDKIKNEIIATGNVEIKKGNSTIYTEKLIYNKNTKEIRIIGDFNGDDFEVGKLYGQNATLKDDFSKGQFFDSKIIFNDGSFLKSKDVKRKSLTKTKLKSPIYSICPDPIIAKDNKKAGTKTSFVSIKSAKTEIDKEDEVLRSKHAFLRIYDVPIFYTPYLSIGLPSKKKKSGFLTPSYQRNTNLGLGVSLPYYFYINDSFDITTTPLISLNSDQIVVNNEVRHALKYGRYNLNIETANNKIERTDDTNIVNRTDKEIRWNIKGKGDFDFNLDTGLDFEINNVSDRDYLRDYHFDFLNYTLSQVNIDNIKGRNYASAKVIAIQELEDFNNKKAEPFIVPLNYQVESKAKSFGEKYIFSTNFTNIARVDGLQYRRLSAIPEIAIPKNFKGNLIEARAKIQGDFYSLEDNFKRINQTQEFDNNQSNYSPEFSLNWRLPLIKKAKKNTIMIEPMANFVVSSFQRSNNVIPNEDSNDSELSVSNLFVSDRISGYDRNENGRRINYGVKGSLYNDYGDFILNIGQGYKKSSQQDIIVRGFNENNRSNYVGQAVYKAQKYFSLNYSFQLNETNYRNDINQLTSTLDFGIAKFNTSYLLIRQNEQNDNEREQISLGSSFKLTNRWRLNLSNTRNVVEQRDIARSLSLTREGCCTTFGFSITETNPVNLTKPQRSFNIVLTFKNL